MLQYILQQLSLADLSESRIQSNHILYVQIGVTFIVSQKLFLSGALFVGHLFRGLIYSGTRALLQHQQRWYYSSETYNAAAPAAMVLFL
jgi:hypothetical protein